MSDYDLFAALLGQTDLLVHLSLFLSYQDITILAATGSKLRNFLSSQEVWRALCLRERVCPPEVITTCFKELYESNCVSYYLLELAVPNIREDLFVCADLHQVRKILQDELAHPQRIAIQHLCRLGLDLSLYLVYRDKVLSVTPLYDAVKVHVGESSILTLKYLGGFDYTPDSSVVSSQGSLASPPAMFSSSFPTSPSPSRTEEAPAEVAMLSRRRNGIYGWTPAPPFQGSGAPPSPDHRRSYVFFREGKNCRYQLTQWSKPASDVPQSSPPGVPQRASSPRKQEFLDGPIPVAPPPGVCVGNRDPFCLACPPALFCDIVFLPITVTLNMSLLPKTHPSGVPVRLYEKYSHGFQVRMPVERRSTERHSRTFLLLSPPDVEPPQEFHHLELTHGKNTIGTSLNPSEEEAALAAHIAPVTLLY